MAGAKHSKADDTIRNYPELNYIKTNGYGDCRKCEKPFKVGDHIHRQRGGAGNHHTKYYHSECWTALQH